MLREVFAYLNALLRHWGAIVTSGVFIGGLSIWQGIGHHVAPSVYWTIGAAGLLIASFLSWRDQHQARVSAEKAYYDSRPRLMLSAVKTPASDWTDTTWLFFIQNYGARAATFVSVDTITSAGGKYTLDLYPLQPEVILPSMRPPLGFKVLDYPYIWSQHAHDLSHTPEMVVKFLEDGHHGVLGTPVEVVIRFRDTDQRELADKVALVWDSWDKTIRVFPCRERSKPRIRSLLKVKTYISKVLTIGAK